MVSAQTGRTGSGLPPLALAISLWFAIHCSVTGSTVQRPKDSKNNSHSLRALPIDLTHSDFEERIKSQAGDVLVMVEFYANWCPHCRHFKPTYDEVGAFFNGSPPPPGTRVWVARIDCADQANLKEICDSFKIHGFPSIGLGTVDEFQDRKVSFISGRTVDAMLKEIGNKTRV